VCLACKLYFKTKRLAHIWGQVTAAYKDLKVDHGERVPDLKFFKIAECGVGRYPSQFPCLTCKAAHCKHLLRALRIVCERTPCRTLEESLRLKLMCDITRFVDILESNGRYLPREAADDAYCAVASTLCTYVKLSSLAYVLHRKLWNIVPKFHYLWHIGRNTYTYNPRTSWVFREEDFVGRIRRIAASASHGHASISLATPIMNKYRQGIEIRMRRRMEFGWYCVAQHWDESRWPFSLYYHYHALSFFIIFQLLRGTISPIIPQLYPSVFLHHVSSTRFAYLVPPLYMILNFRATIDLQFFVLLIPVGGPAGPLHRFGSELRRK